MGPQPNARTAGRALAGLAAALLAACAGAPPPTAEMERYRQIEQQVDMAQLEARYPELLQSAERHFQEAEDANEDGRADDRRHHVHIALARLRTAVALSEQQDALQAGASTESRASMLEQQLAEARAEREDLRLAVSRLERIQALEQQVAGMQLEGEQRLAADRARLALDTAMAALDEAEAVDADRYATGPMRQARATFEEATAAQEAGRYEETVALAGQAEAEARAAAAEAGPAYQAAQRRLRVDQQVAEVFDGAARIPTVSPRITEQGVVVSVRELFAVGEASVRDPREPVLERVAALAQEHDDLPLTIEGHTDSTGSPTTNLNLSQARANAVMERLAALGVPRDRMVAVGRGSEAPIASNETVVGRAQNRRVDVVFQRQPIEARPTTQAEPASGVEPTAGP